MSKIPDDQLAKAALQLIQAYLPKRAPRKEFKMSYTNAGLNHFNEWWKIEGSSLVLSMGNDGALEKTAIRDKFDEWLRLNKKSPVATQLFSKLLKDKIPNLSVRRVSLERGSPRVWCFVIPKSGKPAVGFDDLLL